MNMRYARTLICCIAGLALASTAEAAVSFFKTTYAEGVDRPIRPVSGDFNGDGNPDIVVVNKENFLSYFGGVGDGTFLPPIITDIAALTTDTPGPAAVADFNSDGKLDLAIGHTFSADSHSTTITVHFGDGAGQFSSDLALTTGAAPTSLAVGDFNIDGNPDVVAVSVGGTDLWFHLGNGDGTFQPPMQRDLSPYSPQEIVAGNVNDYLGDDLVMITDRAIVVWLEAGFTGAALIVEPGGGYQNVHLALGDLNGDGHTDLVWGSYSTNYGSFQGSVSAFLGSGTGSFRFQGSSDYLGRGVVLADFNTDGYSDIATGDTFGLLSVLLSDGHGGSSANVFVDAFMTELVVDDFNRDGRPDITGTDGGTLTVLINTSSRGCVDRLNLGYADTTLTIGFTIKSAIPTTWSTWIAWQSNLIPLWSLQIPAVPTAASFTVPIPGVSPSGNVAVLTTMSSPTYGLMCADWKVVDTGGIGPTATALSQLLESKGFQRPAGP
jgi:hypothetical protein